MTVPEILTAVAALGGTLAVIEGHMKLTAPKSFPLEMKATIREHAAAIIDALKGPQTRPAGDGVSEPCHGCKSVLTPHGWYCRACVDRMADIETG